MWSCSDFLFTLCLVEAIRNGIDILVGTPGRIKDHLQNHKLDLSKLKHVVLDEVDQMLDMGFAEQVEEILALSYKKGKCNVLCLAPSSRICAVCAVILGTDEPLCARFSVDADTNPQTLLFSATCPPWVYDVAKKYMRPSCKHVDLIGKKTQKEIGRAHV